MTTNMTKKMIWQQNNTSKGNRKKKGNEHKI